MLASGPELSQHLRQSSLSLGDVLMRYGGSYAEEAGAVVRTHVAATGGGPGATTSPRGALCTRTRVRAGGEERPGRPSSVSEPPGPRRGRARRTAARICPYADVNRPATTGSRYPPRPLAMAAAARHAAATKAPSKAYAIPAPGFSDSAAARATESGPAGDARGAAGGVSEPTGPTRPAAAKPQSRRVRASSYTADPPPAAGSSPSPAGCARPGSRRRSGCGPRRRCSRS